MLSSHDVLLLVLVLVAPVILIEVAELKLLLLWLPDVIAVLELDEKDNDDDNRLCPPPANVPVALGESRGIFKWAGGGSSELIEANPEDSDNDIRFFSAGSVLVLGIAGGIDTDCWPSFAIRVAFSLPSLGGGLIS